MKQKLFVSLFILLLMSVYGETVKVGFFELEPYVIPQGTNKPTGASVDYFETSIAPKMNVQIQWVGPYPMLRLLQSLENNEIDSIIVMAKNPDREKRFLYPSKYYILMKPSLCLLKTNQLVKITKAEDLFNMKIGYLEGAALPDFMKNEKISIDFSKADNYKKSNFDKLTSGRIDAILDLNDVSNIYESKKYSLSNNLKVVLLPVTPTEIYTIFNKSEKGQKLLKSYDAVNETLYKTDTFDKLMQKYR
jgi:polar amino acid transport system substrate-binding protein